MKKTLLAAVLCLTATAALAHHHGHWGPGGCNFWPGFVGGLAAGVLVDAAFRSPPPPPPPPPVYQQPVVVQQPIVVQQPVYQQPVVQQVAAQPVYQTQNVWVEGRYVDQVQANGSVVRTWQPGHYEQRSVRVQ